MISLTLYGGVAFYVTPDSIDYVRGLFPSEQSEHDKYPCCVLSIGGKEYFVRGLAQNVAAEIQDKKKTAEIHDENKTTRVEAQPHFGGAPCLETVGRIAHQAMPYDASGRDTVGS